MKWKTIMTASAAIMALGGIGAIAHADGGRIFLDDTVMLAESETHSGAGSITKIDKPGNRVELKHGPIDSIGWMGMTMFFDVENTDSLNGVAVGDTVDFDFIETQDKRYVITNIKTQ